MEPEAQRIVQPGRVKFGPKPSQTIPLDWVEPMLTKWAETDPHNFGRYLQYAALGELPTNGTRRRHGPGE